jgi:hypothetical protein
MYRLYSVEWYDDWWIGNDLEESGRGLIELLSWRVYNIKIDPRRMVYEEMKPIRIVSSGGVL